MIAYRKFEVIWSKNKETALFKCTSEMVKMGNIQPTYASMDN